MLDTDKVFNVLNRIGGLWNELSTLPIGSMEYKSLLQEIQALSEEHLALVEEAKILKSKAQTPD